MDIRSGYTGRTLFLTGGTGFVGKVALFKIFKEFPDVETIYILMRGKKSRKFKKFLNPQERLDLEVLGSPCFEPLRATIGEGEWNALKKKVKAVNGDITLDHLGISEEDRQTLFESVNFVIHLAATVNFNERLDRAVQMNTLGGLRVLSLAKQMKKLEAMVHVSTCYVNYPRNGRENVNEEKVYPLDCDAEEMVKNILGLQPEEVEKVSQGLLRQFGFTNTYTFTKSLGERLILRYRDDVPLVIVRPSIIGASYLEPTPGWVDALTAAGGLILTAALGVVREVVIKKECIADVVPVDFVVNIILKALFKTQQYYRHQRQLAPAEVASTTPSATPSAVSSPVALVMPGKGSTGGNALVPTTTTADSETTTATTVAPGEYPTRLYNPTTKEELPLIYQACVTAGGYGPTWNQLTESLRRYMATSKKPHPKGLAKCDVTLTDSELYYHLRYYLLRYAPYLCAHFLTQLPEPVGSNKKGKLVEKWGRAVRRSFSLNTEFKSFIMVEWVYDNTNAKSLDDGLDPRSRAHLTYDPRMISWGYYVQLYTWGIFKHILQETGPFAQPKAPENPVAVFERAAKL